MYVLRPSGMGVCESQEFNTAPKVQWSRESVKPMFKVKRSLCPRCIDAWATKGLLYRDFGLHGWAAMPLEACGSCSKSCLLLAEWQSRSSVHSDTAEDQRSRVFHWTGAARLYRTFWEGLLPEFLCCLAFLRLITKGFCRVL